MKEHCSSNCRTAAVPGSSESWPASMRGGALRKRRCVASGRIELVLPSAFKPRHPSPPPTPGSPRTLTSESAGIVVLCSFLLFLCHVGSGSRFLSAVVQPRRYFGDCLVSLTPLFVNECYIDGFENPRPEKHHSIYGIGMNMDVRL